MKVLFALGCNATSQVGSRQETLISAQNSLVLGGLGSARFSRSYQTPAFPAGSGPDFLNAAGLAESDMTPQAVLDLFHRTEAAHGRLRDIRWGPRSLDIDLLAMDGLILPDEAEQRRWMDLPPDRQRIDAPDQLILPHPRMQDRAFVLAPLAELAPDWRHPVLGQTVAQMLADLPASVLDGLTAM